MNAKEKHEQNLESINKLKEVALLNLKKLAKEDIDLPPDETDKTSFDTLSVTEKKRIIKKNISRKLDASLKKYLDCLTVYDSENAYEEFIKWIVKK